MPTLQSLLRCSVYKVVYSHSIGVVSHLNAALLKHNWEDFCKNRDDWNANTQDIRKKYKGSFFRNAV